MNISRTQLPDLKEEHRQKAETTIRPADIKVIAIYYALYHKQYYEMA